MHHPINVVGTSANSDSQPHVEEFKRLGLRSVDHLKSFDAKPNYFGLGFIQLKLSDTVRLHFWHPSLKADVGEEELHDHRYDFRSHVMHGVTTHEVFEFEPSDDGDHGIFKVSCKPGDSSDPVLEGRGAVKAAGSYTMSKGSVYDFPHTQFHRIKAEECITLVERREVVKELATVIKPIMASHVCPFSRKIPEDQLWGYIAELIEDCVRYPNGSYHLKEIPKGKFGEASKITEEGLEFLDALKQNNPVMAILELSDQIGAIQGWLKKYHPTITIEHLLTMNEATTRAFVNGHRS